jgi:parallel beta-helix repeat protein
LNSIIKYILIGFLFSTLVSKSQDTLKINPSNSPYYILNDLTIEKSDLLIIEKGSEIILGDSINIIIKGFIQVKGTRKHPVVFKTNNIDRISWGRIILNSKEKNKIRYANFINGAISAKNSKLYISNSKIYYYERREFDQWPVFFIHNSDINFLNNTLINYTDRYVGEGLNFIGGSVNCINNTIINIPDAIELTRIKEGVISGNTILNSLDDGIDINASSYIEISNNYIDNVSDKGISIGGDQSFSDSIKYGRSKNFIVKNNIIKNVKIGISVKDSSQVEISNNLIFNSEIAFKMYSKSDEYGGAFVDLENNILVDNKQDTFFVNSFIQNINILSNSNDSVELKFDTINNFVLGKNIQNKNSYYRLNYIDTNKVISKNELSTIFINSFPKIVIDDERIDAKFQVFEDSILTYSGDLNIEYRGTSSQEFPKKSYGISTTKEIPFLGLPKEKDWVLYGPYYDNSMLRNAVSYSLASKLNVKSPKFKFVNLYINNKEKGLYLIMQKIKRDSNFVDVEKQEKNNTSKNTISGGYIFKIDKGTGVNKWQPLCFSNRGLFVSYYIHYPKPDDINSLQTGYLVNCISDFERNLNHKKVRLNLLDENSFIDYIIITELMKNFDGYRSSVYFYKYRNNKKIFVGPIWDFNMCAGNLYEDYFNQTIDFVFQLKEEQRNYIPKWWFNLIADKEFSNKISERWKTLRKYELSDEKLSELIVNLDKKIEYYSNNGQTKYLNNWLLKRAEWLDENIEIININAEEYLK